MLIPKNIKQLQERSRNLQVRCVNKHSYVVESSSNSSANHVVTIKFSDNNHDIQARCTCTWATYNGIACSHVLAVLEYMASLKARSLSFWNNEQIARRQKHRLFHLVSNKDEKDGIWITSRGA